MNPCRVCCPSHALLISVGGVVSPEHPTFNPADQSGDKSARRPDAASERSIAARNPREESGGSWSPLKTSLADLFGFPADRRPQARINGLNLYESMSRRYGNRTCLLPSQDSAGNYEDCLKCAAERCRPPPRVTPADMYGNMSARSGPTKSPAEQESCWQTSSEGSQSQDGPRGEGEGLLNASALPLVSLLTPLCFESSLCSSSYVFINKKHSSPGFDGFYRLFSL